MITKNNRTNRQKTQDSDFIDTLIIIEDDTNYKENNIEQQNNLKLRNIELQQLRQKNNKSPTQFTQTQSLNQSNKENNSKRGSLTDLYSNLPFSQTYLRQIQNIKKKEPPNLKLHELQYIKRYESLENLTTNRNLSKIQNVYTTRNQEKGYYNSQQVQIQQLIKTIGSRKL